MGDRYPLCGCLTKTGADCQNRAGYVDDCGVGFCRVHRNDSLCGKTWRVNSAADFSPWWRAAMLARERGDTRWAGLEYGEWPEGEAPDAR